MKLLIVALLAASVALAVDDWKKPDYCGKSECPPFQVNSKGDGWEERSYEAGKWVMTNINDTKYELAYTRAAAKLMNYFKGGNEDNEHMELTTPLLGALKLSKDAGESERNYAFFMWLHPDFQEEAPEPNDEEVEVTDFPEVSVYVRTFGGFASESSVLNEVKALHEELNKDKVEFEDDVAYVAVYDSAWKLFNRHNEVHVMKKGEAPNSVAST